MIVLLLPTFLTFQQKHRQHRKKKKTPTKQAMNMQRRIFQFPNLFSTGKLTNTKRTTQSKLSLESFPISKYSSAHTRNFESGFEYIIYGVSGGQVTLGFPNTFIAILHLKNFRRNNFSLLKLNHFFLLLNKFEPQKLKDFQRNFCESVPAPPGVAKLQNSKSVQNSKSRRGQRQNMKFLR